MMNKRRLVWSVAFAVGLAMTGVAGAQNDGMEEKKEAPKPLLSGPEVEVNQAPGVVDTMGGESGRMSVAERIPPRVYERIMLSVLAEDAPDEIRATAEQRERITVLREAHEEKVRAFRREHADELRALRQKANLRETDRRPAQEGERPERQRDRPRDEMDEGMEGMEQADRREQESARQRLREVMSGAPGVQHLYAQVWEVLEPAQREFVEGKFEEFRERRSREREEQYVGRWIAVARWRRPRRAASACWRSSTPSRRSSNCS
jgi:hypothetical protein